MLKMFKLQINSKRNENISRKNYLRLSHVSPYGKPNLRKFDLSCSIAMYHFGGLL